MPEEMPFLKDAILFLAAAGIAMPAIRKLNISPVLGFLCIGVLIGPFGLQQFAAQVPSARYFSVSEPESIRVAGELGVVFLLFSIGLEMSLSQIWGLRRTVFGLGSAQILVTGAVLALCLYTIGLEPSLAVLLALCVALSSTAIVMQLLSENMRLGTRAGRTAFGILLMQDLAVVPILFLVQALGSTGPGAVTGSAVVAIGQALAVIAVILLAGRTIVRPLLRHAGGRGQRETFMAAVLLLILGTSALTAWAGLSMALGAFLAGLIFSSTEYRHQINSDIEPFKGLLLSLFFISVGMRLDLGSVWSDAGWLVLAALSLIVIKTVILFVLALAFRHSLAIAAETAILLGEGGEFAIVAVSAALALGVVSADLAQFVILVVVMTMFAAPGLAALGRRVGAILAAKAGDTPALPRDAADERIVIGGFGRVGQMLARILEDQRIPYVAVDRDPDVVARAREKGAPVYYGDASDSGLLEHMGIRHALAFVTTMDTMGSAEALVLSVHRAWPHVPVYSRARDPDHARHLKRIGSQEAIPETAEASLQLSEALLFGLGIPEDAAQTIVERERGAL